MDHQAHADPRQFTQLGSPRTEVVRNAVRDLEYHDELLTLLRLPEQQNRDAVMILHMGGVFGDKAATLNRFRANYAQLSPSIKARLVLENDDVSWSVHDLLPICEELDIPLVLDFHHHNIIFDADQLREGTRDIRALFPRLRATWDRKRIRQKMHYSEPCPGAITGRQRRKHSPRVAVLPPCDDDMDLMIEAKDKEQAVFQLMRSYRLPGWDSFNNVVPYERDDENRPPPKVTKKSNNTKRKNGAKKTKKAGEGETQAVEEVEEEPEVPKVEVIPDDEVGMGGPLNRVFWPVGMEEWLRPKKREVNKKKKKPGEEEEG
jgi:UV DNA damage endonuclease